MKKIRRNDLKGLTEMFPVFDRETQQKLRGGYTADEIEDYLNSQLDGLGTSYTDGNGNTHWERNDGSSGNPYTQEQFDNWCGAWQGGYVEGWGYVGPEVTIYGTKMGYGGASGITSKINSAFELECLWHYLTGGGNTMSLNSGQFSSIVNAAATAGACTSSKTVTINGETYTAKDISFYNNSKYDYAIGTARLYYDNAGNCVGFRDYYDFDAQAGGTRSYSAESATRIGSYIPGRGFWINYGVGAFDYE